MVQGYSSASAPRAVLVKQVFDREIAVEHYAILATEHARSIQARDSLRRFWATAKRQKKAATRRLDFICTALQSRRGTHKGLMYLRAEDHSSGGWHWHLNYKQIHGTITRLPLLAVGKSLPAPNACFFGLLGTATTGGISFIHHYGHPARVAYFSERSPIVSAAHSSSPSALAQGFPRPLTRDPQARQIRVRFFEARGPRRGRPGGRGQCLPGLRSLGRLGKTDIAYATALARYGVKQTRNHRKVGGHLNVLDVLSKYCQSRKGLTVKSLDKFDPAENVWEEILVEDKHAGPAETARVRLDFRDWLASLKRRDRRIAESLAEGNRTADVARRYKITAAASASYAASWPQAGIVLWATISALPPRRSSLHFFHCRPAHSGQLAGIGRAASSSSPSIHSLTTILERTLTMITLLLVAAFFALVVLAWLFRQRLITYIPRKDTMFTATLIVSVVALALLAELPDLVILLSATPLMSPFCKIALVLAATVACIGCSRHAEPAKPAVIHWKGQDGGYEDTSIVPPDKAHAGTP